MLLPISLISMTLHHSFNKRLLTTVRLEGIRDREAPRVPLVDALLPLCLYCSLDPESRPTPEVCLPSEHTLTTPTSPPP